MGPIWLASVLLILCGSRGLEAARDVMVVTSTEEYNEPKVP
jgi:hypothetical protein